MRDLISDRCSGVKLTPGRLTADRTSFWTVFMCQILPRGGGMMAQIASDLSAAGAGALLALLYCVLLVSVNAPDWLYFAPLAAVATLAVIRRFR